VLGLTQPLVSYHLRRVRTSPASRTRRKAQWVYYSIEPNAWRALIAPLRDGYLVTDFLPEAAYGASDSCDTKIPSFALGASEPNGVNESENSCARRRDGETAISYQLSAISSWLLAIGCWLSVYSRPCRLTDLPTYRLRLIADS
jgi:hypothetical protein